jgi:hypothetical protein
MSGSARRPRPKGAFWPTSLQYRLLGLALDDAEQSLERRRELPSGFSLDDMEPGSFELMPLIYQRFLADGSDDPRMSRLKGIYRKSWFLGTLLLEETPKVLEALDAASVPAIFLEGPYLGARYYPDVASRYCSEISVLVDEANVGRAVARLARLGWFSRPAKETIAERRLFLRDGVSLLLRTRLAYDFGDDSEGSNALLREDVERQVIAHADIPVLSPTDTLLAVCTAGARQAAVRDVRWLADAAMIVRSQEVDWDRLVARAAATHQVTRLQESFDYLARLPGPHPPPEVRHALAAYPVSRRDRMAYRCSAGSAHVFGALPTTLGEYLAVSRGQSIARVVTGFPAYLRARWSLPTLWRLPGAVCRRIARSISKSGRDAFGRSTR